LPGSRGATTLDCAMRRTKEFGSLYRGREGQWSWIAHRVTGVGILLFLFAHIVDTSLVGWGPDAYNRVISLYHNPIVETMELGLVAAVIFHGLNGVRIMIMDFWPATALHQRRLMWGTMAVFVGAMAPITWIMGNRIVGNLF
jgi:succinate dehydrogenase / fumarate reductase, cytochrome b subunit